MCYECYNCLCNFRVMQSYFFIYLVLNCVIQFFLVCFVWLLDLIYYFEFLYCVRLIFLKEINVLQLFEYDYKYYGICDMISYCCEMKLSDFFL